MTPGQNHRVEVGGALEGETVADAVRFVSAGTSVPGILYVHADHLGSPQKMTDASQALVWDVYTLRAGALDHRHRDQQSAVPRPVCRCGNGVQLQLFPRLRSHHRSLCPK